MKLKTRREKVLLFLTILVVVGGLGFYGYTKVMFYLTDPNEGLDSEIERLEYELREKQGMLTRSGSIVKHYEEVKTQLTVPGDPSVVKSEIRAEIDGLLKGTGFPFQMIRTQDAERDREGFLTTYKVSIEGDRDVTIDQLARFLYEMEDQSEVLEVADITFTNPRQSRESPDGQYEFRVQSIVVERLVYSQDES